MDIIDTVSKINTLTLDTTIVREQKLQKSDGSMKMYIWIALNIFTPNRFGCAKSGTFMDKFSFGCTISSILRRRLHVLHFFMCFFFLFVLFYANHNRFGNKRAYPNSCEPKLVRTMYPVSRVSICVVQKKLSRSRPTAWYVILTPETHMRNDEHGMQNMPVLFGLDINQTFL